MKKIFLISLLLFISCKEEDKKTSTALKKLSTNQDTKINSSINGKKIFNGVCATCHLYGTGGGITLNDKKSWTQIYKTKNIEVIYNNVLNGFNSKTGIMPRKGGCISCTD